MKPYITPVIAILLGALLLATWFPIHPSTAAPPAAKGAVITDGYGGVVIAQTAAPTASGSGNMAVGRVTKNLTGKTWDGVYCPSAGAKFRVMSTATVAGHQFTIPAGQFVGWGVNPAAPYRHYSTPTACDYYQQ